MTGIEEPTLDEIPAEPRDLPGPEPVTVRTVEQIERDMDMLLVDWPVGDPPAAPAPPGELFAYYRRALARAERKEQLWAELYRALPIAMPHRTLMLTAIMHAEERAASWARELRGWIREEERKS